MARTQLLRSPVLKDSLISIMNVLFQSAFVPGNIENEYLSN